jgi:hypothetical protein
LGGAVCACGKAIWVDLSTVAAQLHTYLPTYIIHTYRRVSTSRSRAHHSSLQASISISIFISIYLHLHLLHSYHSSTIAVGIHLRQPRDGTQYVHCGYHPASSRHHSDQPQNQLSPTTEHHRAHHALALALAPAPALATSPIRSKISFT